MIALTLALMLGLSTANAQETASEPPPAIPADAPLAAPPLRPRALGERSPARLDALRRYQDERLVVRGETELHGGGTMVVGGVWGGGYRPGPYGGVRYGVAFPGAVIHEPVTVERSWAVYRGPERLTTPDVLRAGGELGRAEDLERDIRRAKFASNVWFAAAGAGIAMSVSGMLGLTIAEDRQDAIFFNQVALGGAGVAAVGLIGGSFPSAKARRLSYDTSETLSLTEAQALVRKKNEALRQELGLSPDDVWQAESGPPPR